MAKKEIKVGEELDHFKSYIKQPNNEDAKRPLLYPLFKKLFGEKFRVESDAHGADVYIEGQLLVESKTTHSQWLDGFFQALHYQRKYGLAYNTIMVIAHEFVGIWKVNKLPETAVIYERTAEVGKAPNVVGKENAKRTSAPLKIAIKESALYWLEPKDFSIEFAGTKSLTYEVYAIKNILTNLDSDRLQINTHNFIDVIERMKAFFSQPIDAVHAFYTLVAYWQDIASLAMVAHTEDAVQVLGFKGHKSSPPVKLAPRKIEEFRKFINSQYVFTNEGSGLTVDYYFSRFDEVLARIDPEYVKQHGIFFTNDNLSKFALWFVKENFSGKINEDYVVFDPAGGSGNLISSWKGKLKHKIISELQPDLLRIVERRMQVDPWHVETGFTITPKTLDQKGLNFLDCSGADYLAELKKAVRASSTMNLDRPLAFLLNPPYKNTDENVTAREKTDAHYEIHPSIIELTGEDAGKERYLAFLGQILNIAKEQEKQGLYPVVMIFTPTSWLIPRPTYIPFREIWDRHFVYQSGFIVTSNEWFKLDGKWPLAFTMWAYKPDEKRENKIKLTDFTHLRKANLDIDWDAQGRIIDKALDFASSAKAIHLNNLRGDIKKNMPLIRKGSKQIPQPRYDFSHAKKQEDYGKLVSGFPLKDAERHYILKRKCGEIDGNYLGFMDDCSPVRLYQDSCDRLSTKPDRIWFYLDNRMIQINTNKVFSGPPDKYAFCAYNLETAKFFSSWFGIAKSLVGKYPVWANQYNIWAPKISKKREKYYYSLCFAFVLAENRCVVTKFEADNPVKGAPEIFVDNPLSPINRESFWNTVLEPEMAGSPDAAGPGMDLAEKIKELYRVWSKDYCKGQVIKNVGLQDEAYFKYFDYVDFLTPHSGLIQIRKYAALHDDGKLLALFKEIADLTKVVREEIYRVLVEEFGYFG